MAKKIENNSNVTEISTIRDILMGQQMHEYEHRFKEISDQVNESENQILKKMEQMQTEFTDRFTAMEDSMKRNLSTMDTKIERSVDQDRIRLGQLLANLSKELLNGK